MLTTKIENLAREQGYTIPQIEREMGFSRSSITKWKKSAPSVWKVKAVADFFGITVDELLTEPEAEEHDMD